jgi:hypothetical protein
MPYLAKKNPDRPNTCPTGLDGLIFGSGCSNCYFDPSSASEGLSVASSRLFWTYSSSYDFIKPDNGLIISQVKCWSFYNLSDLKTDLTTPQTHGQSDYPSFWSKYEYVFSRYD